MATKMRAIKDCVVGGFYKDDIIRVMTLEEVKHLDEEVYSDYSGYNLLNVFGIVGFILNDNMSVIPVYDYEVNEVRIVTAGGRS